MDLSNTICSVLYWKNDFDSTSTVSGSEVSVERCPRLKGLAPVWRIAPEVLSPPIDMIRVGYRHEAGRGLGWVLGNGCLGHWVLGTEYWVVGSL